MKKISAILAFTLLCSMHSFSTNLVGYIQGYNKYYRSSYPFPNAYIELQYWNGSNWVKGTYTYSSSNGYYYFNNIRPGYYYNLRINNRYNYQIYVNNNNVQYIPKINI